MGDTYHEAQMLAQEEAEAEAKAFDAAKRPEHPVPFSLIVTPRELSDLFFNHNLQNRRAIQETMTQGNEPVSRAMFRRSERFCIEADAHEFLDCLPYAVDKEARAIIVPWLVADFLSRV